MILAFSSTTEGLVSFFRSSQASQKSRLSSLYSERRNSRKISRPSKERSIISKLRAHDNTSSRLGCLQGRNKLGRHATCVRLAEVHKHPTIVTADLWPHCSSAASILSILVHVCRSLLSILSSFLD